MPAKGGFVHGCVVFTVAACSWLSVHLCSSGSQRLGQEPMASRIEARRRGRPSEFVGWKSILTIRRYRLDEESMRRNQGSYSFGGGKLTVWAHGGFTTAHRQEKANEQRASAQVDAPPDAAADVVARV